MGEHFPTEQGATSLRYIAAELLIEATERGDLDFQAVGWAVSRILSAASRYRPIVSVPTTRPPERTTAP